MSVALRGRMHTLREAFNQRSQRNLSPPIHLSCSLSLCIVPCIPRLYDRARESGLGQYGPSDCLSIRILQYARATWIVQVTMSSCDLGDPRLLMKITLSEILRRSFYSKILWILNYLCRIQRRDDEFSLRKKR